MDEMITDIRPEYERHGPLIQKEKSEKISLDGDGVDILYGVDGPTEKQKEFRDNPSQFKLFGGAVGGGKATPLDSLILTPYGFRENKDLNVGSAVTNPDGSVAHIIQVHPIQYADEYELKFHDGTKTSCNVEHLWLAWRAERTVKYKNKRIFGESSAKIVTTQTLMNWLNSGYKPAIPVNHEVPFNVQNRWYKQEIDPYLAGLLLGDGQIGKNIINITSMDIEIEEYLTLNNIDCCKSFKENNKAFSYSFRGKSREKITNHFKDLGLNNSNSLTKFIPDIYKYGSIENRYALIQGLMDTDGTVDSRGQLYFTSISKQLAEDTAFVLRSLGAVVTISDKKKP